MKKSRPALPSPGDLSGSRKTRMDTCTGVEVLSLRGGWAYEEEATFLGGTLYEKLIVNGKRLARKGKIQSKCCELW